MTDNEIEMMAPDGHELQGTAETVLGAASVSFFEGGEYDHDGGTEMFWDTAETDSIEGVPLFTDESGMDWLQHHLIPAEAGPLSDELIERLRVEIKIGTALKDTRAAIASCKNAGFATKPIEMQLAALEQVYAGAKANNIAAIAAELAARPAREEEEEEA